MIDLWVIAAILAGIVLLGAAYGLFWVIVESVHPFTYRRVPLSEVHDHILAIFHRGLNRSQILITSEQNGKMLRFRKTYKYGEKGMAFHLFVRAPSPTAAGFLEMVRALEMKTRCNVSQDRTGVELDVDCDASADTANTAADVVLANFVCASDTSTFSVRVKGGIMRLDRHIGGETRLGNIVSGFMIYDEGRPYNWVHYCTRTCRGTWAKSFGAAMGRIASRLFPPRE